METNRSLLIVNITGRRFKCISKRGYLISNSPDCLEIGEEYIEVREGPVDFLIEHNDVLLIRVDNDKMMYVDAECFELVNSFPSDLFLIPLTQN